MEYSGSKTARQVTVESVPSDPSERPEPLPELLRKHPAPDQDAPYAAQAEVGEFRPGSPFSQWGLARYLVGRAMVESVGSALTVVVLGLLALAAVSQWVGHSTLLAVLFVLVAAGVLALRLITVTVVRRLIGFRQYGALDGRMSALVKDTRPDVLRELRRVGLPGRTWTLPLLALRLLRRSRRADTIARLRTFDVDRAVPKARVDELYLLLRGTFGGDTPTGWQTGRRE
jgi:hypothetical protein